MRRCQTRQALCIPTQGVVAIVAATDIHKARSPDTLRRQMRLPDNTSCTGSRRVSSQEDQAGPRVIECLESLWIRCGHPVPKISDYKLLSGARNRHAGNGSAVTYENPGHHDILPLPPMEVVFLFSFAGYQIAIGDESDGALRMTGFRKNYANLLVPFLLNNKLIRLRGRHSEDTASEYRDVPIGDHH